MGGTGHLATIQPLRCQGETRQRYASSGPQGARQRRPQVSDTPTIRLAGIHPCQRWSCQTAWRLSSLSARRDCLNGFQRKDFTDFCEPRQQQPPYNWADRLATSKERGEKGEEKKMSWKIEEERCIRVNLSQSANLWDYQDTCTLFASKHLRGD